MKNERGTAISVPSETGSGKPDPKNKRKAKATAALIFGILLTLIATDMTELSHPRGYTLAARLFTYTVSLLVHSVVLGAVSFLIGLALRRARRLTYSLFACLFLFAGLWDVSWAVFETYVVRPKALNVMREMDYHAPARQRGAIPETE